MKKTTLVIGIASLLLMAGCSQYQTESTIPTGATTGITSSTGTTVTPTCPAMPTVASCPTNQEKYVVFSTPDCGEYYACRAKTQTPTPASKPKSITSKNIDIANFNFSSPTVDITVGSKVTRTNSDSVPHTILADDNSFQSAIRQEGEKFSFTFSKAGTYKYHCSIHPSMKGTIVVK